ncbi:MAG: protein kinase [Myxococcota bacterium]|nr:protein kinase [Myxococcota bacterium]
MKVCPHCRRQVGDVRFCPYDGTPLAHLDQPLGMRELGPGDLVEGRYEVVAELGRGGIGVVYLAEAKNLGRDVALKVLKKDAADRDLTVARFAREARAASVLDHPNVVRVYEFGFAAEGFYYMVMELLDGRALADVIDDEGRLAPERALAMLRQIAAGMARAHALGVVHRDLKPENIMVDPKRGEHVTLLDFGLSKTVTEWSGVHLTHEGDVFGTPDYMPPEQWLGASADARADVYAFGVIAYELFSGQLPFPCDTVAEAMQGHLYTEPPTLDVLGLPGLPPGVSRLVTRCMQKKPSERWDDMQAVAAALEEIVAPTAPPPALPTHATEMALGDVRSLTPQDLRAEIDRLLDLRRHRLAELVPELFGGAPPPLLRAQVEAIELAEDAAQRTAEDLALVRAQLAEAEAAVRAEETAVRQRLLAASLDLAARRDALPEEEFVREETTQDDALRELISAERALARILEHPGEEVERRLTQLRAVEGALDAERRALDERYERLEAALAEATDAGRVAPLAAVDGAIAAMRARLESLTAR